MDLKTKRDVIVVGAGAAGLTAALHLANQDLTVSVIDGAVHPGAENWSGCVYFGENLAHPEVLGPNWQENTAIERPLVARGVFMTNGVDSAGISYKDPQTFKNCATVLRPVFDHDLSEIARSKGIEILSRTTVLGLIKEDGKVIGVSTAKGPIYSDLVFLAEGDAAHLVAKEGYSNLPSGDKGHYLQGIKEVIHLPPSEIEKRFKVKEGEGCAYEMIIRNARIGGKTVQLNMGAFIYTNRESLSIGLVLPLDNLAKHFKGDHNNLMEWFKSLPITQKWIEGGERTAYGAKIINANGYKHLADFCDNGLAIGGACTGIGMDFPYPNYTGPASFTGLCLGKAVKEIKAKGKSFSKENLREHYEGKIRSSQYYKDMEVTQDWADYIASTQAFFGLFTDLQMDCSHPFFEKGKGLFSAFKESVRSFFYHGQGKLGGLFKDLKNQQRCAGAIAVSPLGFIKGLFSSAPLQVNASGDLRLEVYHGSEEVTENMAAPVRTLFGMSENMIKGAFNTLYRNDGVALKDRFETLNCIIGKQGFLIGAILLLLSPIIVILALILGILDTMKSKKKLMKSDTAKRVMAARKAQEISSFKASTSVEDKLSTIVYETEEDCHIKVHWPLNKFLPESDPNSALWHICPAGVYHAKSDPAGMLRPVVDYENCVKCESCWRGSPLADWGRRDSHRLIYRVKTTALTSLIRHLSIEGKALEKNDGSEFNSPVYANEDALNHLQNIDSYITRIHEIIHSTNRTLDATQRFWIKQQLDAINEIVPELEKCYDGQRSVKLLEILNESIETVKEFHRIERFFWIDAELLKLRQHCLTQLGLQEPSLDNLIPENIKKSNLNADEHFTHAHIHHIKEKGLSTEGLELLNGWISQKDERQFLSTISELAKLDLSLTAMVMMAWLGRKFSGEDRSLIYSNSLTENPDGTLSGKIPFALSAIDKKWILIQENEAWLIDHDSSGVTSNSVGTVGLRSSLPLELTLEQATAVKLENFTAKSSFKESVNIFSNAVISAGEYLLQKSMDHGTGRIQFPDLFQDEHGRDGIIKFGAVKSLISHIACRLEMLKIALKSNVHENFLYVQAGKWLGTQEGSFTYNASQVFGGTGFSEDDTLSPYYRDASIFKYLLGDPYVIQKEHEHNSNDEKTWPAEELLESQAKWFQLALDIDNKIQPGHKDLAFRANMDYAFTKAAIEKFIKAKNDGEPLLLRQQIIDLAAKIYWNSATNRELDSKSRERHIKCGKLLVKKDWKNVKVRDEKFTYEEFLEEIPAQPTGYYLTDANFDIPKYSKESLKCEERLHKLGQTLDNDFKEYFIDKDFDGMSYVRYAEAKHGHSNEVIKMFHDKGYMRLIIPSELGGGGSHKAEYYLLISASMQYGDPALSLIIQASTSIGTSPMLLAYKKDVPRAIKEIAEIQGLKEDLKQWSESCKELDRLVKIPDPTAIKGIFKPLGDEVKALAKKNSVFKSYCGGFLYDLHKAGQAGMSFQLELMGELLLKASGKLEKFLTRVDELSKNFSLRKEGVGFFLSMIASGQTSAFALTEPSAGSDTARVATRAELKEVEIKTENGVHSFEIDGENKVLIALDQTRYYQGTLQIRLQESEEWSDVMYDKYNWEDDSGYRYFQRNGEEFKFSEFGNITERDGKKFYIYYELTGSKMWITNGRFAGLFALYAKTNEGVTGFCCDRYIDGLTIGKDEDKMGQNASPTNEVFLDRVRISKDFVLGIEGRGQVNALETLNVGRAGLSLSSLALSEDVLDAAIEFSANTDEDMALLGKMSEEVFGGFASAYEMIGIFDKPGSDARMESAIGKFMNSEILHRVILYSEGIHGAHAQTYNHDVEKKKRDARILNIYEGTNEIQRFLILKDLIEQISKKEALQEAIYSKECKFVKIWDSARLKLLNVIKQVKLDLGSKAWMDSQLQPVFFPLAEIAGWLKYSEGAIWRYNDTKGSNAPEVLIESLIGSIERSFSEMNRRFILFEETYSNLSKGIRPPDINICSLLLSEEENKEEETLLGKHTSEDSDVTAFLSVRPLNKPEVQIVDGQLIETSSVLTTGSELVLKALSGIPASKKKIVIVAPINAESLIKHLSSSADVLWLKSDDVWTTSSDNAKLWLDGDIQNSTLIFDASSAESSAAARYYCEKSKKRSIRVNEFQFTQDSINMIYEGSQKSIGRNAALLLSNTFVLNCNFNGTYKGEISVREVDVTKSLEISFPPEPPLTESVSVESPENAANYLKQELGLEQSSNSYDISDSELNLTEKILVGSIKDGDISRDTLAALNSLVANDSQISLCLAGAESFDKTKISKLSPLPNHICLIDFPEVWLKDPQISSQYIKELLQQNDAKLVYFANSLAGEAGVIAAEKGWELKTNVTKVQTYQSQTLLNCENAEGTIEEKFSIESTTIAIMAGNLITDEKSLANNTCSVSKFSPELSFTSIQDFVDILNKSASDCGADSISDANFIIDIGYGIGNQDNYDEFIVPLIETLKEMDVKFSIGASRKLVETLKILPPETQIGQSGNSVTPTILIAVGISGAPQHINYIGKNTSILSFNIDAKAPLMVLNESKPFPKVYPLAGDLKKTIPLLTEALQSIS